MHSRCHHDSIPSVVSSNASTTIPEPSSVMEKRPSFEMDLEEWELLLPDDCLLSGGKGCGLPREAAAAAAAAPFEYSKGVVRMDYFSCPPDDAAQILLIAPVKEKLDEAPIVAVPAPTGTETTDHVEEQIKEVITHAPPPLPRMTISTGDGDDDADDRGAGSDATFDDDSSEKKESVDMIMLEGKEAEEENCGNGGDLEFDCENKNDAGQKGEEIKKHLRSSEINREEACCEGFRFGVWRWRLNGIGALCSIGIAAATICILILGGRHQRHSSSKQQSQNQKLQFQIYADDKNLKQVVQHAARLKLNQYARGAPIMARANISFGGYYDGLV